MHLDWDDVKFITMWILAFIIFVVACLGFISVLANTSCNKVATEMGLPHQYSLWTDCMIQYNGQWLPLENWRYMETK